MKYFTATVLSFMLIFGAIRSFHIYQISAPTPEQAVSKYYAYVSKGSPMEGETITAVWTGSMDESKHIQTVLFHATGQDPSMAKVGYAFAKKTIFGWFVERAQSYGRSPRPRDVIVQLDQFDQTPVLYGQVFLADAARVEAVFTNRGPGTVTSEIPDGYFVLIGSEHQDLDAFKILDSDGRILRQFTKDELQSQ